MLKNNSRLTPKAPEVEVNNYLNKLILKLKLVLLFLYLKLSSEYLIMKSILIFQNVLENIGLV